MLQNAMGDTHWTEGRKSQIQKVKLWFDENERFVPPSCANEVYHQAFGGAENIPVPMDDTKGVRANWIFRMMKAGRDAEGEGVRGGGQGVRESG